MEQELLMTERSLNPRKEGFRKTSVSNVTKR